MLEEKVGEKKTLISPCTCTCRLGIGDDGEMVVEGRWGITCNFKGRWKIMKGR